MLVAEGKPTELYPRLYTFAGRLSTSDLPRHYGVGLPMHSEPERLVMQQLLAGQRGVAGNFWIP